MVLVYFSRIIQVSTLNVLARTGQFRRNWSRPLDPKDFCMEDIGTPRQSVGFPGAINVYDHSEKLSLGTLIAASATSHICMEADE